MKTVILTIKYRVSDEFYEKEMKDSLVADIQSGKFQREAHQDMNNKKPEGLRWLKANIEVINK